jgi:hypothetical protein
MKKILVLILILFTFSQVFSEEDHNNSNNKYYKIARSLYDKPFGEVLCVPFIWLGDLTENGNDKPDASNEENIEDSNQQRKSNITNWSQLSLNYFTNDAKNNIDIVTGASQNADNINTDGKFGVQYQHEISGKINDKFSFDVKDEIFYSEKSHEQRNSFFFNELKAKIFYQHKNTFLKLQVNNRFYESEETNFLNLPGVEYDTQQQMVNTAIMHFKQDIGKLNLDLYSSFRNLEYKYAVPEEEDEDDFRDDEEDEWDSKSGSDFDVFSLGKITFKLTDNFKLFTRVYLKNDFNEFSEFNETQLGGGFEYASRIDFSNSIFTRFSYYNLNSDGIDDIFSHNLLTEARYTKRFNIPLAGFVTYINRSVYDEEQSELLRVSNLVRVHLKYSYLQQNTLDSFVLAGIKYNPENNGNLVFGEFNQFLIKQLYLSGGAKLAPDLFTEFAGKFEYYLHPLRSIWLKTEYLDFKNKSAQNIISLGSTIIF